MVVLIVLGCIAGAAGLGLGIRKLWRRHKRRKRKQTGVYTEWNDRSTSPALGAETFEYQAYETETETENCSLMYNNVK